MSKGIFRTLLLCVAFTMFGWSLFAIAGTEIKISRAAIDVAGNNLTLWGANFDVFGPPVVSIGDFVLPAESCTVETSIITCELGEIPIEAGQTWTVSVSARTAQHANEEIDVAIPYGTLPNLCNSGDVMQCYSAPPATMGVGACQAGTRVCLSNGSWSECQGEIVPSDEICDDGIDNDCDSLTDLNDPDCAECQSDLDCQDGLFCNGVESCINGNCTEPPGDPCAASVGDGDADCSESCDETADSCTAAEPDGTSCENGFCQAGICVAAECQSDLDCQDGLFCNGVESCINGNCTEPPGDPCAASVGDGDADCSESCDETADSCTAAEPDGTSCENGFCQAGICVK